MNQDKKQPERRRFPRIKKNFIISYCVPDQPDSKREVSQVKNISLGGMCFVTAQKFEPPVKLKIEMKTPYVNDDVSLVATVRESRTMVPNLLFETRVAFDQPSPEAEMVLNKIAELFNKGK